MFSTDEPSAGDRLFLVVAVPRGDDSALTDLTTLETRVTKQIADTSKKNFHRFLINTPYRPPYRGAPVLDVAERVVGVAAGGAAGDDSSTLVIPAAYLVEILNWRLVNSRLAPR
jgi:hypothetical protein